MPCHDNHKTERFVKTSLQRNSTTQYKVKIQNWINLNLRRKLSSMVLQPKKLHLPQVPTATRSFPKLLRHSYFLVPRVKNCYHHHTKDILEKFFKALLQESMKFQRKNLHGRYVRYGYCGRNHWGFFERSSQPPTTCILEHFHVS